MATHSINWCTNWCQWCDCNPRIDEEKRKALRLLVNKYSKGFEEIGEKYIDKSWSRTATFKIEIEHITAKAKYSPH